MPGGFRPKAHIHIWPVGFGGLDLFRRAAGKTSGKLVCGVCTPPDQHTIKSKNEIIAVSALSRHCRRVGSGRMPTEPGAMCGPVPCPKGDRFPASPSASPSAYSFPGLTDFHSSHFSVGDRPMRQGPFRALRPSATCRQFHGGVYAAVLGFPACCLSFGGLTAGRAIRTARRRGGASVRCEYMIQHIPWFITEKKLRTLDFIRADR